MHLTHARLLATALAIFGLVAPVRAQAVRAPIEKPAKVAPTLDLNSATVEQLEELPGIGAARAEQIVKARPYKAVEDLKAVKGITPAMYDKIAARVRVSPSPAEPRERPKAKAAAPAETPGEKVDLNTATAEELEELPGIGAARAEQIIKARPFKSVENLNSVKGLTPAMVEKLADRVRVAPAPSEPKERPRAKAATTEATPSGEKIDLNTATVDELQELPGIGAARAEQIVKARPFKSAEDLKAVKGISPAVYEKLADRVRVSAAAPAPVARTAEPAPKPAAPAPKAAEAPRSASAPKEAPKAKKAELAPGEKVNLNTASFEKLDALPGIGPVRADLIIKARPFASIEDIKKIKGIKEVEFGKIKDIITVK